MLKFGPYVVDLAAGEVRRNGYRIRLQEKPLRVLALLAERQGQLVSREELRHRLWPEETFVDFEAGLNTAVSKLRDALSDRADKPRFIETIPRRGYRFLTPVEIVGLSVTSAALTPPEDEFAVARESAVAIPSAGAIQPSASESPSVERQIAQIRSAHAAWIWGGIAAAVLVLLGTVWWLTPLPDPATTDIFRVTQTGHLDYLVRPATDGVRIFYVQRAGEHYDLMQASVRGGEAQKVGAPFPNTLVWDVSPDRTRYLITSFARRGEASPLWSWPAIGGTPVKLGELVSGSATFSPDGKQIVYHVDNNLLVANSDGTMIRKLVAMAGQVDAPVWSPDGSSIRFVFNDPVQNSSSIWEISPDGSNLHAILPHWQEVPKQFCGAWTPDGRYFLFVDNSQPPSRLYALREKHQWWRRSSRGPFLLAAEATGSWSPLVSPDGKSVYYYGTNFQSDLETLDPATQQFSAVLSGRRPTMLSVSRDGRQVAYVQLLSGGLWASQFDGSSLRQIQLPGIAAGFPRFSPDNKLIAFTAVRDGLPDDVYVVPSGGGTPRRVGPEPGDTSSTDPDWSPDGSRLVVDRDPRPSQPQPPSSTLALVDLETSRITDVPDSNDLHMPRWSPDGRYIAAIHGTHTEIRLFDTEAQSWTTLARGKGLGYPEWSADSSSLYYQDTLASGEPLYRVLIANRSRTVVASFQKFLDTGVGRCVFVALSPQGTPLIAFDRNHSDIYGARLMLP